MIECLYGVPPRGPRGVGQQERCVRKTLARPRKPQLYKLERIHIRARLDVSRGGGGLESWRQCCVALSSTLVAVDINEAKCHVGVTRNLSCHVVQRGGEETRRKEMSRAVLGTGDY